MKLLADNETALCTLKANSVCVGTVSFAEGTGNAIQIIIAHTFTCWSRNNFQPPNRSCFCKHTRQPCQKMTGSLRNLLTWENVTPGPLKPMLFIDPWTYCASKCQKLNRTSQVLRKCQMFIYDIHNTHFVSTFAWSWAVFSTSCPCRINSATLWSCSIQRAVTSARLSMDSM